jgi:hypothetical protein
MMVLSRRSLAVIIFAFFILFCFFPPLLAAKTLRGKVAPKDVLPAELRTLDVKDYYIGAAAPDVGVVQTVIGYVVVARGGLKQAYFAAAGDRLYEKDVVFTLKKSRCRFKLNNEDVATMGENTKVGITSFAYNRKKLEKRSAFDMAKGKAMFYTLRLFRYKDASMSVSTPTAVAGVRGTKFGVEVIELDGTPTTSLSVLVADLSDMGFRHLAQSVTPPFTQTNVYTFEGSVAVTSITSGQITTLGAGQGVNAGAGGLGSPFVTPLSISQGFQADTQVIAPDPQSHLQENDPTRIGTKTGTITGTTPDHSTVIQNQNMGIMEPQPGLPTKPPAPPGYPQTQ